MTYLSFADTPASERNELFLRKLQQCSILFDFTAVELDTKGIEQKRQTLNELIEYITSNNNVIFEAAYPETIRMLQNNVVRHFPPNQDEDKEDFDQDEDEPNYDPGKIMTLFNSEDPRERDLLKTLLHRIYGKFLGLRSFIRKHINFIFLRYIFEGVLCYGIAEFLEILGSIINGFAGRVNCSHNLARVLSQFQFFTN
eukprot:sb/3470802/